MTKDYCQLLPLNGSIVTDDSEEMPSRTSTFFTEIQNTFRSVDKVQWSTYHTSWLNLSFQLMALRP